MNRPDAQTMQQKAQSLHAELSLVRRQHRSAEARLSVLLLEMDSERLWEPLGYSSLVHYAEVELDLLPRQTIDMARTARRMRVLPQLREAFESGALGWTKAREVTRVATEQTDSEWVDRALSLTSRELERHVAACAPGDSPPDGETLGPARRRVTFEMEAADAEVLFRALRVIRVQGEACDGEVDDGALLAAMAQRVLYELPVDSDTPAPPERFRIVIHQCPDCARSAVADGPASGGETHVGHSSEAGRAHVRDPGDSDHAHVGHAGDSGHAHVAHAGDSGHAHVGQTADSGHAHVVHPAAQAARSLAAVSPSVVEQAGCDAEVLAMLQDGTSRLTRTIPPATRRAVMARDHGRCAVPYCRSTLWIDLHHVRPRSMGGTHDPSNIICICAAHHRAIHENLLSVVHDWETGRLVFERPDGNHFGPSNSGPTWVGAEELARQDALVGRILDALDGGPRYAGVIAMDVGVDSRRVGVLLGVMRGAGLVTRDLELRWAATGDAWVSEAA